MSRIVQHGFSVPRPFGVNVAGHLESEKGMGESVRSSVRVLRAAGIPIALKNLVDAGSTNREVCAGMAGEPYAVNLLHVNPDGLPSVLPQLGEAYFEGRYTIGYWAWELPEFPAVWHPWFDVFDEIWVPSEFVRRAIARHAPIPVVKIPHSIVMDEGPVDGMTPHPIRRRDGRFTFLFLFDFSSYWQRKHPLGLVEAFTRAFPDDARVALLIKTVHQEFSPQALTHVRDASRDPRVTVVDGVWSRKALVQLLRECDCFVSLHRAEGFGLALAEAMALAKPVIATGYSGNMEFMNPENSLPVRFQLTEIGEDHGPYGKSHQWADPDLDHAATLMRWVVSHPVEAQEIGVRAAQTIRQRLSPSVIGAQVRDRLSIVTQTHQALLARGNKEKVPGTFGRAEAPATSYAEHRGGLHVPSMRTRAFQ